MKIKTIGDSFMAVAFPFESSNSEQRVASPEERAANAALEMLHAAQSIELPSTVASDSRIPHSRMSVRVGLHSGAVTAGVIGTTRMQYDVWGDTVNVASRMEGTSEPGRIHISEAFANALKTSPPSPLSSLRGGTDSPFPIPYSLRERGALEIKGKGMMQTYWLEAQ